MNKNLPIYNVVVNEDDETGINFISLVDEPAIEIGFHSFSSEENKSIVEMLFESFSIDKDEYSFKSVDNEQQKLMGPIAIPDIKIYRRDEIRGEYYMVFSKEQIQKMADKFTEYSLNQNVNFMHQKNSKIPGAFVSEIWTIESKNDKSVDKGFNLPIGTLMGVIKVKDKKVWDDIVKSGKVKGFSLEGILGLEKQKLNKMENTQTETKLEVEAILKDGTRLVAADWNVGTEVFVITPEGRVPAESRAYEAEDGTIIEVKDGKVLNYTPSEEVGNKEIKELETKFSNLEASINEKFESLKKENEELKKENTELSKKLEEISNSFKKENEELSTKVEELSKTPALSSITKEVEKAKTVLKYQEKPTLQDQVARLRAMKGYNA